MTKIIKFTALGVLVQSFAIGCFIAVVHTEWAVPGKFIIIGMFAMFVVTLLFFAEKVFSFRQMLWLSGFLTVGLVVVHKVLGFTYFPGLAKDFELFSYDHLVKTLGEFAFVFGCYFLAVCVVVVSKKTVRALKKDGVSKV